MFETLQPNNDFDKYDEPRLHMERLMKAHLIDFGIPIRILSPLESAGIRTLGDLTKQNRKTLIGIKSIGRKSVEKLESFLAYHRLSLAE